MNLHTTGHTQVFKNNDAYGFSPNDRQKRVYVSIILDQSGSMNSLKREAINGFNNQVETIRRECGNSQVFVSLITFNERVIEQLWLVPLSFMSNNYLTEEDYRPDGWTAMYDAVGHTVDKLVCQTASSDPSNSYLVIVISDGEENRSRMFNQHEIAQRIQKLQNTGRWTFVYIGSNQNLATVRRELFIPSHNTMSFAATPAGYRAMEEKTSGGINTYFNTLSCGHGSTATFFDDAGVVENKAEALTGSCTPGVKTCS